MQIGSRDQRYPVKFYYTVLLKNRIPFPAGTRGFFYYRSPLSTLSLHGSICFRLTQDPDPSRFNEGADLKLPDGRVWQRKLGSSKNTLAALTSLLFPDGTPEIYRSMPAGSRIRPCDIQSLDPHRIQSFDFRDLSGQTYPSFFASDSISISTYTIAKNVIRSLQGHTVSSITVRLWRRPRARCVSASRRATILPASPTAAICLQERGCHGKSA